MKMLLIVFLMMFGSTAFAHGYSRGYHANRPHYNWVSPVIIGGAIGYGLGRYYSPPVIIQSAPVYVAPQPTLTCSEWQEVIQPDGHVIRERTCYQR